ncbi:MAG: ribonuclease R [Candidatus Vogelbacteria bacterium]|nr:ribonuclease R [Candidatus Vogelbacteria bacterium]
MKDQKEIMGTISINSKGVGYVTSEELEEDVIITPENLKNVLHRDTVAIELLPKDYNRRQEGSVIRVVSRASETYVGTIETSECHYWLKSDDRRIHVRFLMAQNDLMNAKVGEKVVVKMLDWSTTEQFPAGKVVEVLGIAGDNNVEMKAILRSQGLADKFPREIEKEVEAIPEEISKEELSKRRDFRKVLTFTIDPDNAKDFDDALSFEKKSDGNYEIGIHIADVSHFLREDTALDEEAKHRATSIYLVDRVIPMLPERLSNNLASLEADKDRLTFSCVVALTPEADVVDYWLGRTVIHSDKRFTYEEAQEILDNKRGLYYDELNTMNELAKKMALKKFAEGAIAFETDEIKFKLDENGKPLFVYKKLRQDTNKMIEEYMLLANRVVAEHVFEHKDQGEANIFVYRIHDYPDIKKMGNLQALVKQFGHQLKMHDGQVESSQLSALLDKVQDTREEQLISTTVMRSMAKAIYSTKNIGHYGLAFDYYTHFTSPIRRYPDVMVHRLLQTYLEHKAPVGEAAKSKFEKLCEHCSDMERKAMEAEWDSIKMKQVEFMSERIGKVFDATISGVTEYGMYVQEKESASEGMIRMREMTDDYYNYDEKSLQLVGSKKGKKYRLGDKLKVKVMATDLQNRTITYKIVEV